jgi:hypothetical protein
MLTCCIGVVEGLLGDLRIDSPLLHQIFLLRLCCTDPVLVVGGRKDPNPICYLIDTDIVRASKLQHPVQGSGGDGNLGRLGLVGARSKRIADHALVSADRRLDFDSQIVAAGCLPGHAATLCDGPQVAVALVGAVPAEALVTALARGGTMMAAAG